MGIIYCSSIKTAVAKCSPHTIVENEGKYDDELKGGRV